MSLAILKMALAQSFHRQPTDDELRDFLSELRKHGERIYVPQREEPDYELAARILDLHREGLSIRKIARTVRVSKSQVHRALSQNSDLFVDSQAA
jgi:DNA invertase Pin-like site-specific DNA recombinase